MEAKLKDLLKSGLVLIASTSLDKFLKYACARGVFPTVGNTYNGSVIVMA